ncbi:Glutathione S-transferase 1 [Madurella mycetomatis]|uniref:Glutathione S-transferase 1 n=1 Tax=Madurella mycetomatis TaxID=100816 RepID=A0A175WFY9_9PEZI|nr:Glutathione S-transferase 1 [Madurella mycetomatis]
MASARDSLPQPKVKLYWLNESRAQRFVWLLEELGLEYEVEIFQRNQNMLAPPELQKIHPLGKSPILSLTFPKSATSSKERQLVLTESGFIAQYLCEHFARGKTLLPKRYRDGQEGKVGGETEEWMRYQHLLHYAEGSLMPPTLVALILSILKSSRIPFIVRPITSGVADKMFAAFVVPDVSKHLAFLESQLETSPNNGSYLCGTHLTAADILVSFPLLLVRQRVGGLSAGKGEPKIADKYPKLWAYLQRLQEEPGYMQAEARIDELEKKGRG